MGKSGDFGVNLALTALLEPIGNSPSFKLVREQVYEALREAIITGILPPGERIMETHLAQLANVSRIPVREAIRKLESEGLVTLLPRRGIIVEGFTEKDILELYRIRGALEELACSIAAERQDAGFAKKAEDILRRSEDELQRSDWERLSECHSQFNKWLGEASGGRHLKRLFQQYEEYVSIFRAINVTAARSREAIDEHREILDAIKEGDSERAMLAARKHSQRAARKAIDNLRRNKTS